MRPVLWLLVLAALGIVLYAPAASIPYFEDDFGVVLLPTPDDTFHYFSHSWYSAFYRPIPGTLLLLIQRSFGLETWPIRVVNLLGHILLSYLVFAVMRRLGLSSVAACIGSLFLLVSQAASYNVLNNDTTPQILSTLFGSISLWLIYRSKRDEQLQLNGATYALGVALFGFSLLSKETGAFFAPMILLTFFVLARSQVSAGRAVGKALLRFTPFAVLTVAYLWVRSLVGAAYPSSYHEYYGWSIGSHLLTNSGLFLFGLSIPTSTVDAYVAWKSSSIALAYHVFGAVIFALVSLLGLIRSSHARLIRLFLSYAGLSLALLILQARVSEAYLYNALPFCSVLVGIGIGTHVSRGGRSRLIRVPLVALLAFLLVVNVNAVRGKTALMKKNGEKAATLIEEIRPFMDHVPANGRLILYHDQSPGAIVYSTYLRDGFLLLGKNDALRHLLGRPDLEIEVTTDSSVFRRLQEMPGSIVLSDAGGSPMLLRIVE